MGLEKSTKLRCKRAEEAGNVCERQENKGQRIHGKYPGVLKQWKLVKIDEKGEYAPIYALGVSWCENQKLLEYAYTESR